jgi:hypothetical protein
MAVCKRVSLITLVLGTLTAVMIGFAPTAPAKAATWKCYRSTEENHHCYALAYWHMAGCTKECIQGGVADEVTESMDVPGWASGDFVDNEIWESSKASHGWVESGTTAGGGIDCCSLHRFEADVNNNGTGYSEYVQPGSIPLHEAHDYVIQDLEYNGIWRVYWGQENANWYEAGAYNHGYSSSTDELEAGFEGGANTQPTNSAAQALAGVWGEPPSWHPWEGEYSHAQFTESPATCIEQWPGSWIGNSFYHTPC